MFNQCIVNEFWYYRTTLFYDILREHTFLFNNKNNNNIEEFLDNNINSLINNIKTRM